MIAVLEHAPARSIKRSVYMSDMRWYFYDRNADTFRINLLQARNDYTHVVAMSVIAGLDHFDRIMLQEATEEEASQRAPSDLSIHTIGATAVTGIETRSPRTLHEAMRYSLELPLSETV